MINELRKSCNKRINDVLKPEMDKIAADRRATKPVADFIMKRIEESARYSREKEELAVGIRFSELDGMAERSNIEIANRYIFMDKVLELHGLNKVISFVPAIRHECVVLSINLKVLNEIDE